MFGLQPTHLVIILVIALLLFAPSRLPELVRALGKTLSEFRASVMEMSQDTPSERTQPEARSEEPPQAG